MRKQKLLSLLATLLVCIGLSCLTLGCGQASEPAGSAETQETAALSDGRYVIEAETDSSMFRAEACELTVTDGRYEVVLTLPGEGFSKLYFGSAADAATAEDDAIYEYYLNDEGKYTFDLPVEALDEELAIAAFGHRRDTWYDHTIVFHAPTEGALDDAD